MSDVSANGPDRQPSAVEADQDHLEARVSIQHTLPAAGPPVVSLATIVNQRGLHARAAAKFVKLAGTFDAQVTVVKGDIEVSGSSILGLMMLVATPGSELELRAVGPGAHRAVSALAELIANRFDEES